MVRLKQVQQETPRQLFHRKVITVEQMETQSVWAAVREPSE
jgi:hypothetical protein